MNKVTSTISQDGQSNVVIEVTGILDTSDVKAFHIVDLSSLKNLPKKLRLDGVQFAFEPGLIGLLWWEGKERSLITPMFGCQRIDYIPYNGRHNPMGEGATGSIILTTKGWEGMKHFSLLLDLTKQ